MGVSLDEQGFGRQSAWRCHDASCLNIDTKEEVECEWRHACNAEDCIDEHKNNEESAVPAQSSDTFEAVVELLKLVRGNTADHLQVTGKRVW